METIKHPIPNQERITSASDINYSSGAASEPPKYVEPNHTSIEAINKNINKVNEGEMDDDDEDLYDTPNIVTGGYQPMSVTTPIAPDMGSTPQ